MRKISSLTITEAVADLVKEANYILPEDVIKAIEKSALEEEAPVGREVLEQILLNNQVARREKMAVCQDTGIVVVFVELGNEVYIEGDLYEAINTGVRKGYQEGYLRTSVVESPLKRVNTGDNTPAVVHLQLVPGDKLRLIVAPKGAGSENMSLVKMLKPADGKEGIRKLVLQTVKEAGANPCPPIIVGIGLGGTFEKAALLAKEALLRPLEDSNPDPEIAELEKSLLADINKLGIGPQGLGGRSTALAVKINTFPCHIASLPVAININCHVARHKEIVI
ncbi:MAG TPA: fumarate hydratase [Halanaerobiaceae bacterium]|nr:fumarate hydratase [Bacillota bacterium]HHU92768.1 fumarate hydratase [Halanaerobiaceae bacterium]HOA40256.1 fumarate hydratase [Halanaerobiales bacterium]HPZ62409.1 fumarate hydratase [Halanaerobiales bacterium]HQD03807.1 fumarate hydratase [Halanaerobiales bacterium]